MARPTRLLAIALGGAAIANVAVPAELAGAAHGDNSTSTFERDNNSQNVAYVDLTQGGEVACAQGQGQLELSEITLQEGSGDIYCYDANYGDTGWVGNTYCSKRADPAVWRCDRFTVRFNYWASAVMDPTPDSAAEKRIWKSVGCHEFGHTSSVGHRSHAQDPDVTSCMRYDDYFPQGYDAHDIDVINADA